MITMRCLLLLTLTCFSAFAGTQVVILGTGTPRADPVVRRAAARVHGIPALTASRLGRAFLTHLRSDHTLGLPDLIFSPWVLGRTAPLDLFGPPGAKAMVDHIEAAWQQAFGYRIDAPDRSIVISGDCSPSPALLEAAKGCDLLLHEVYSETEPESGHFNRPDTYHGDVRSAKDLDVY
jgi:ribonuclease BN (tRNA processing enzyme)